MAEKKDEPKCDCGEEAVVVSDNGELFCYDCAVDHNYCPSCGEKF